MFSRPVAPTALQSRHYPKGKSHRPCLGANLHKRHRKLGRRENRGSRAQQTTHVWEPDLAYLLGKGGLFQMEKVRWLERQIFNMQGKEKYKRNDYNRERKWFFYALREKIVILDLIKIKNFYSSQITGRKMKRQEAAGWKELSAGEGTREVLLQRIIKSFAKREKEEPLKRKCNKKASAQSSQRKKVEGH